MFSEQIMSFSKNLDDLRDFVVMIKELLDEKKHEEISKHPMAVGSIIYAMHKADPGSYDLEEEAVEKIEKYLSDHNITLGEDLEVDNNKIRVNFSTDRKDTAEDMFSTVEKLSKNMESSQHFYCNSLISLVSSVEWFVSQIIHKYYKENPKAISSSEKQLSLEDLSKFDSVEDARIYLIDKRVESVLRGDMKSWITFLREKLNLSMGYLDPHMNQLIEVALRRNLLVHNGGIVNGIYLNSFPKELKSEYNIGDKVTVSLEYLFENISRVERCFALIAAELWKKLETDSDQRGKMLINMAVDHLSHGRCGVAESFSCFVMKDKSLSESDVLYGKVNYWLAKKMQDKLSEVVGEIEGEDFSAKSRLFICAKSALLDHDDDTLKDITYLLDHDDEFTIEYVEQWPLFLRLREQGKLDEIIQKYKPAEVSEDK